jgi:hypothetical protein
MAHAKFAASKGKSFRSLGNSERKNSRQGGEKWEMAQNRPVGGQNLAENPQRAQELVA